jgi:hypothetical protein
MNGQGENPFAAKINNNNTIHTTFSLENMKRKSQLENLAQTSGLH